MSKKISELTAASALTGAELVEVVQSGTSKRTTVQDIADLGSGGGSELQYIERTITSAEVLNANSSPVEIIAAQGVDTVIVPISWIFSMNYAGTPYGTNLLMRLRLGTSTDFADISGFTPATTDSISVGSFGKLIATTNENLNFFVPNGNPTDGNSDIKLKLFYKVITL